jgi:hypothetical protein
MVKAFFALLEFAELVAGETVENGYVSKRYRKSQNKIGM